MKILVLSDIHFGENTVYPNRNQGRGADYINSFGPLFPGLFQGILKECGDFDLLLTLGDAIANKDIEQDRSTYQEFLDFFKIVSAPVKHLIGNHDVRWLAHEDILAMTKQPGTNFSFDARGVHFIMLNARWDGYPFTMGDLTLAWLRDDLRKTSLPTVVCLHYPADDQNLDDNYYFYDRTEAAFVKERDEVRKVMEQSGKVRLFLSGHTHFFRKKVINDIVYVTCPSLTENDGEGNPLGEYLIVDITNKNLIISKRKITPN